MAFGVEKRHLSVDCQRKNKTDYSMHEYGSRIEAAGTETILCRKSGKAFILDITVIPVS